MANVGTAAAGKTLIGTGNTSSATFADIGTNSGLTQFGVVIAEGAAAFQASNAATNGQVLLGATGANPLFASLTSSDSSITFTPGINSLSLTVAGGTTTGKTITGDSGGSLSPTLGNWNILGGPGVTATGSGSTLTINSVVFTDTTATTMAVDNGYFATAAGTYNLPATALQGETVVIYCDTSGAVVVDAPASNFIRIGNLITSSGGTMTSTLQGDCLVLRYRLSTLTWCAVSTTGTWLVA